MFEHVNIELIAPMSIVGKSNYSEREIDKTKMLQMRNRVTRTHVRKQVTCVAYVYHVQSTVFGISDIAIWML